MEKGTKNREDKYKPNRKNDRFECIIAIIILNINSFKHPKQKEKILRLDKRVRPNYRGFTLNIKTQIG